MIKKTIKLFISTLCLINISACPSHVMRAYYNLSLESVENPDKINFQKTNPILIKKDEDGTLNFSDKNINIDWQPTQKYFGFQLKNKTNSTIKLLWNDGVFMDSDGKSYRIANGTSKVSSNQESIVPTPILKDGLIEDIVYPVGWTYYDNTGNLVGLPGRYKMPDIFPIVEQNNKQQMREIKETYDNKTFKIMLPIEINNQTKEYIFIFKVDSLLFKY